MRPLFIAMIAFGVAGSTAAAQQPAGEGIRAALNLTPSQDAAWSAYRATIPDPARAEARRSAAVKMYATLPTPRRLDLVEAEMTTELAELRTESAALKGFYATLSPEQQRMFDQRTLAPPPADD